MLQTNVYLQTFNIFEDLFSPWPVSDGVDIHFTSTEGIIIP